MAIVSEIVSASNRPDGRYSITIFYESTGFNITDHFEVHNDLPEPMRIRVRQNNVDLFMDWYGGGILKNPNNPNVDTVVPAPPNLSWRRASKSTNWSISVAYPSYPPA